MTTISIEKETRSERLARPVDEMWEEMGIGPTQRDNLRKMGLFPEIIEIPGSYVRLITPAAEQRFIERLIEHTRANAEALEAQRHRRMNRNGLYKGAKKRKGA
jgi:hypothetical protein